MMGRWWRGALSALRRAVHLTRVRPGLTAWATSAVAAALLIFALIQLVAKNVTVWTSSWRGGAACVVYLTADAGDADVAALVARLQGQPGVETVELVPPERAMRRLQAALGADSEILAGVEPGALPASLEVTLAPGVRDVAAASPMIEALERSSVVEDVEITANSVDEVAPLLDELRAVAWGLGLLFGALATWIVAGALRLGLAGLGAELRVARLLGAPAGFVRAPAAVAGALQGVIGAALALVVTYVLHRLTADDLGPVVTRAFGAGEMVFIDADMVLLLFGFGAALGGLGGWLATGRGATRLS